MDHKKLYMTLLLDFFFCRWCRWDATWFLWCSQVSNNTCRPWQWGWGWGWGWAWAWTWGWTMSWFHIPPFFQVRRYSPARVLIWAHVSRFPDLTSIQLMPRVLQRVKPLTSQLQWWVHFLYIIKTNHKFQISLIRFNSTLVYDIKHHHRFLRHFSPFYSTMFNLSFLIIYITDTNCRRL